MPLSQNKFLVWKSQVRGRVNTFFSVDLGQFIFWNVPHAVINVPFRIRVGKLLKLNHIIAIS